VNSTVTGSLMRITASSFVEAAIETLPFNRRPGWPLLF
jgi:hypothetical protein